MPQWEVFTLPGLGFDSRIYSKLRLENCHITHLNWIKPKNNESIKSYAHRMFNDLELNKNCILIGQSFGGIIGQEIAKAKNLKRLILLSTITQRTSMPLAFKLLKPLGLHHILTPKRILVSFPFWKKSYGYQTAEDQTLFKTMVGKNSKSYMKWAISALSNWQGIDLEATQTFHLHGSNDKTFPIQMIKSKHKVVRNAGHFMVFQNAEEVSRLINEQLNNWNNNYL